MGKFKKTTPEETRSFIDSKGWKHKQYANHLYLHECPLCGAHRAMHIGVGSKNAGAVKCWSCNWVGNIHTLKNEIGDSFARKQPSRSALGSGIRFGKTDSWKQNKPAPKVPTKGTPFDWSDGLAEECVHRLWSSEGGLARKYLTDVRGFSEATIREFELGCLITKMGVHFVTIPVRSPDNTIVNVRFRSVDGQKCPKCKGAGCTDKAAKRWCNSGEVKKSYLHCANRPLPLFGTERLPKDTTRQIAIVEGEFDVISLHEFGFTDAVVSGTSGAGAFAEEWLDQLEPYDQFLLCYDDDEAGKKGAKELSSKLGKYRCRIVSLPYKDANDCLKAGVTQGQIVKAFQAAKSMVEIELVKPDSFGDEIEDYIQNPNKMVGLPTSSSNLNAVIAGLRPGVMVVTGKTSEGKTSFSSWLVDDQARMDVPVGIFSFEDEPVPLAIRLLRIELGCDPRARTGDDRRMALQRIGKRPLYVFKHGGYLGANDCIEACRYAVRRKGTRVVLVDHLGYLLKAGQEDDERGQIEKIIRDLHTIGLKDNVTFVLVAHPNRRWASRRHPERKNALDRVRIHDLKGASAVEQDADYGLVVERWNAPSGDGVDFRTSALIHVDKLRGTYGVVGAKARLYYDSDACMFADKWDMLPAARTAQQQQRSENAESSQTPLWGGS